jgi:hypothetical protein
MHSNQNLYIEKERKYVTNNNNLIWYQLRNIEPEKAWVRASNS